MSLHLAKRVEKLYLKNLPHLPVFFQELKTIYTFRIQLYSSSYMYFLTEVIFWLLILLEYFSLHTFCF